MIDVGILLSNRQSNQDPFGCVNKKSRIYNNLFKKQFISYAIWKDLLFFLKIKKTDGANFSKNSQDFLKNSAS